MIRITGTLAAAVAAVWLLPITASADTIVATVAKPDFRGAPPFKRKHVSRAEVASKTLVSAVSTGTNFRGSPPFKRSAPSAANTENPANVESFARFEELESKPRKKRRRGPPGKSHLRFQ